MANEFRYGIDQNGVRHPVCDDTRVDWSSYAALGAVNIVPYPYSGSAGSAGGTTYALEGPVIDVNCSNSSGVSSFSISGVNKTLLKPGITHYLSGAPATSASTENVRLYIILKDDNNNEQRVYCPQGGEIAFNVPDGYFLNAMGYYVAAGQTLDHVKVKPMIALSPGLSYVEPAMTNQQLTDIANDFYANDLIGYIKTAVIKSANTTADQISAIESFIGSDANYSVRNFVTANNSGQTNGTGMLYKYSNSYAGFFYTSYLTDKLIIGRLYDGTWSTREV